LKGHSVLKTLIVLSFVFLLIIVSAGAMALFSDIRIVLLPPVKNEEHGATVIMRGLDVLPLVTDAGRICIDPDARVVTASEVKICSNSVLVALSRHGHVVARLPYVGFLAGLARN
jgi:hypothetical protein